MSSAPFPDLSGSPDANGSTRAVVTPDLPVLTSGSEP
jgi:hypothetical protein